jgi:hypothetical protein
MVVVESGAAKIFDHILYDWLGFSIADQVKCPSMAARCIALRDHYAFWATSGESDDAGKVLLVDSDPSLATSVLQVGQWGCARQTVRVN